MRFKFNVEISRKTEEHITKHNLTRNDVRDALSGRVYFRKTLIGGEEYWRLIAEESEKRLYKKRRK